MNSPQVSSFYEWQDRLNALIAAGRSNKIDVRNMADELERAGLALRTNWAMSAPIDASMH
jgi:hypothetical protein